MHSNRMLLAGREKRGLEYRCLKSIPENLLSQQQKLLRKTTEGDIRTHFKRSVPNFLKNAIIGRKDRGRKEL